MFMHDKGIYQHVQLLIVAGRIDSAIVTAREITDEGLRVEALRILCKSLLSANRHQLATHSQNAENDSMLHETIATKQSQTTISTLLLAAMVAQATLSTQHSSVLYTMTIILDEIITAVRQVEDTRMGEAVLLAVIRMVIHVMRLDETPATCSVNAPFRHMAIV